MLFNDPLVKLSPMLAA